MVSCDRLSWLLVRFRAYDVVGIIVSYRIVLILKISHQPTSSSHNRHRNESIHCGVNDTDDDQRNEAEFSVQECKLIVCQWRCWHMQLKRPVSVARSDKPRLADAVRPSFVLYLGSVMVQRYKRCDRRNRITAGQHASFVISWPPLRHWVCRLQSTSSNKYIRLII